MTTVRQLNKPAFWEGPIIGLQQNCSHLFVIIWCATPYLHVDKKCLALFA